MTQTKLADLINPEVLADMVSFELQEKIRFSPLANVDTTLQGQPGSILKFPAFTYIGDAVDVPEGTAIPLDKLGSTSKQVEVKKAGKGVEITDEAVLSGYGDPLGEAAKQLQLAIANKVDEDIIAALKGATQTAEGDIKTVAGLQAAIDMFDDEDDEPLTLLVSPADASALRTDANTNFLSATEIGANRVVNGSIGEILGVQIVRSRKLEEGEAFLVKSGALKLVMKRGTQVESERNIVNKTTVVTADQHYAPYLYNDAKVVKFNGSGNGGDGGDGGEETP